MRTRATADARAIAVVTATLRLENCEIKPDGTVLWSFERGLFVRMNVDAETGEARWHLGIQDPAK